MGKGRGYVRWCRISSIHGRVFWEDEAHTRPEVLGITNPEPALSFWVLFTEHGIWLPCNNEISQSSTEYPEFDQEANLSL